MSKSTLSRRQAIRLGLVGGLGLLVDLALPGQVRAWGSFQLTNTHEFILRQVYPALAKDPAFEGIGFPKLEEIVEWEGQDAMGGTGKGPDHSGWTNYSQHYYNPRLLDPAKTTSVVDYQSAGDAPLSAALYIRRFTQSLRGDKGDPKCAAWAAHFAADVWVPYHVNGCSYADLKRLMDNWTTSLPEEVYGSMSLAYLTTGCTPQAMLDSARYFLAARADDPGLDWFDPWYWNGSLSPDLTSSHTFYEGAIYPDHQPVPKLQYLMDTWSNPEPGFDRPDLRLGRQVQEFVKKCAAFTVTNLEEYYRDPQPALINAVNSVYTLWRASFSGLRLELKADLATEQNASVRRVTVKVINKASAPVSGVRLRLTSDAADPGLELPEVALDGLGAGEEKTLARAWSWEDPHATKEYTLRLQAVGAYAAVPDAQYAEVSLKVRPERKWPKEYEGVLESSCLFSGVMGGYFNKITEPGYCSVSVRLEEHQSGGTGVATLTVQDFTGVEISESGTKIRTWRADQPRETWTATGSHSGLGYRFETEQGTVEGAIYDDRVTVKAALKSSMTHQGQAIQMAHTIDAGEFDAPFSVPRKQAS